MKTNARQLPDPTSKGWTCFSEPKIQFMLVPEVVKGLNSRLTLNTQILEVSTLGGCVGLIDHR
jgi:hypothetical protein